VKAITKTEEDRNYFFPHISIEEIFSSKGRVKIIKILVEEGELNISEIGRRASLNHNTTLQHLNFLIETGYKSSSSKKLFYPLDRPYPKNVNYPFLQVGLPVSFIL
jgi:DNA-binding transcriptional ArsR family regulator